MSEIVRLRDALLSWYDAARRDLPWRRTTDPYAILVSEVMLQQTRVEVVIPYYERFLGRFPDVRALARASDDDLLGAWSGLGYYRRARNLREAARTVATERAGRFPAKAEELETLAGVGRYTAGAVASIAFGERAALVDGNVARVLARLHRVEGDVRAGPVQRVLWELADELLDPRRPGDFNQALMELGATVCVPKSPRCSACPVAASCRATRDGVVAAYPAPRTRKETVAVRLLAARVRRDGLIALVRRAKGSLMEGLLDVPATEAAPGADAPRALRALLRGHGLEVGSLRAAGRARHGITRHRIEIEIYDAAAGTARVPGRDPARRPATGRGIAPVPDPTGVTFVSEDALAGAGLSSLARKVLRASPAP